MSRYNLIKDEPEKYLRRMWVTVSFARTNHNNISSRRFIIIIGIIINVTFINRASGYFLVVGWIVG